MYDGFHVLNITLSNNEIDDHDEDHFCYKMIPTTKI